MKPVDLSKASGVLMYSVVNRGNGAAAASAEGHISLVSGWQGDVVPTATNQTIQVPRAKNPDGSSITGPLVIRILDQSGTTAGADDSARRRRRRIRRRRSTRPRRRWCPPCRRAPTGVKSGVVKIAEHRLGVRRLREDAVSRHAGSGAHLPEERLQSRAALRAAVHREGSARARHRVRGHARSQFVLPLREEGRRRHAESGGGRGALGDLRGQLAVGHVPARVHPARLQPGRERTHRVGGQQSEHRVARAST